MKSKSTEKAEDGVRPIWATKSLETTVQSPITGSLTHELFFIWIRKNTSQKNYICWVFLSLTCSPHVSLPSFHHSVPQLLKICSAAAHPVLHSDWSPGLCSPTHFNDALKGPISTPHYFEHLLSFVVHSILKMRKMWGGAINQDSTVGREGQD